MVSGQKRVHPEETRRKRVPCSTSTDRIAPQTRPWPFSAGAPDSVLYHSSATRLKTRVPDFGGHSKVLKQHSARAKDAHRNAFASPPRPRRGGKFCCRAVVHSCRACIVRQVVSGAKYLARRTDHEQWHSPWTMKSNALMIHRRFLCGEGGYPVVVAGYPPGYPPGVPPFWPVLFFLPSPIATRGTENCLQRAPLRRRPLPAGLLISNTVPIIRTRLLHGPCLAGGLQSRLDGASIPFFVLAGGRG